MLAVQLIGPDQDVLGGETVHEVRAEAIAHRLVMGREAEGHAVVAAVLGGGMARVVDVVEPLALLGPADDAPVLQRQPGHRAEWRGVVPPARRLTDLQARPLDLKPQYLTDRLHATFLRLPEGAG